MKKILVIEDNEVDQLIIKRYLNKTGYEEILFAFNGQEGIEKARTERPDLIVVDTLLPDTDGFSVCKKIRKIKGLTPKVIINTGNIDAVDAGKAREAGADDYTVKTSDCLPLMEAIRKLLP